ncbi:hypothetical protein BH11PSE10_BH11PSE10_08220 [soil metagenome]
MTPTEIDRTMRAATQALLQQQLRPASTEAPRLDAALAAPHLRAFVEVCVQGHFGVSWTTQQQDWWAHCCGVLIANLAQQAQLPLQPDADRLLPRGASSGPLTHDLAALLRPAAQAWDEDLELDWAVRYWEQARKAGLPVNADFGEFWQQLEWTGLWRHLSLLGRRAANAAELPLLLAQAVKVSTRYKQLSPLAKLLDDLQGGLVQTGFR